MVLALQTSRPKLQASRHIQVAQGTEWKNGSKKVAIIMVTPHGGALPRALKDAGDPWHRHHGPGSTARKALLGQGWWAKPSESSLSGGLL